MSENEKPEMIIKRILEERGIQQKFVCEKIGIPQQLLHLSHLKTKRVKQSTKQRSESVVLPTLNL